MERRKKTKDARRNVLARSSVLRRLLGCTGCRRGLTIKLTGPEGKKSKIVLNPPASGYDADGLLVYTSTPVTDTGDYLRSLESCTLRLASL